MIVIVKNVRWHFCANPFESFFCSYYLSASQTVLLMDRWSARHPENIREADRDKIGYLNTIKTENENWFCVGESVKGSLLIINKWSKKE